MTSENESNPQTQTQDKGVPAGTLLVISQVYIPDPAAVGVYIAEVAAELVKRGWRVVVMTASSGYDDPSIKYKREEVVDGVEIWPFRLVATPSIIGRRIYGWQLGVSCRRL